MVLRALAAAVVTTVLTGCASTGEVATISQRDGRIAASGVPNGATDSSTVRGGMSSPMGLPAGAGSR